MKSLVKRFIPSEKGLNQILGQLESEVMEVLWLKNDVCVRDVLNELQKNKEIAYTTVMTVMDRLHKKGFVKRFKEGQAYIYSPAVSKEQLKEDTVKNVIKGIIDNHSQIAMAQFVDQVAKDPESLKQLQDLIKNRFDK